MSWYGNADEQPVQVPSSAPSYIPSLPTLLGSSKPVAQTAPASVSPLTAAANYYASRSNDLSTPTSALSARSGRRSGDSRFANLDARAKAKWAKQRDLSNMQLQAASLGAGRAPTSSSAALDMGYKPISEFKELGNTNWADRYGQNRMVSTTAGPGYYIANIGNQSYAKPMAYGGPVHAYAGGGYVQGGPVMGDSQIMNALLEMGYDPYA